MTDQIYRDGRHYDRLFADYMAATSRSCGRRRNARGAMTHCWNWRAARAGSRFRWPRPGCK